MTTKIDLEFSVKLIPGAKSNYETKSVKTEIIVNEIKVAETKDHGHWVIVELQKYLVREHPKPPIKLSLKYDKTLQELMGEVSFLDRYKGKKGYDVMSPMDYNNLMDMVRYYNLFA